MNKKIVVMNWADESEIRVVGPEEYSHYDRSFVFPLACEPEIREVIRERARLKKIYDDSFALVLQLNNKFIRENRRD